MVGRPPQNRARRSSVALGRQSGPVGRTAVLFVFIRFVRSLALSYVAPLSVRRKLCNGNVGRASLPPFCVSPVLFFFFIIIKGDVTVSSLPPRYVTDITGHRSVYPTSPLRIIPFPPRLYSIGVLRSLALYRNTYLSTLYPTSLLYLLSPNPLPAFPPLNDLCPPPRRGKRERRTAS